ncbi:hypothetical protein E1A91_D09G170400v1 [Gossypium mustelinum]|uniref:Uncharacterized protein n=1 Tax=Gossypium mustelinum TaxID=34275 RepID=A0A5D2TN69_GOSMU|nr:hypothetical protein E1A91_D09G170400v1 [Gossypium mustelinum]
MVVTLEQKCFFRQLFFNPVAKVDYLTLRHGFISAHFSRSPLTWFIVVIFVLVDVHENVNYGTKLEMALQINNQNTVTRGTPLIQPSDQLFWFGRSRFILTLLLCTLFTNAFQLAFIWVSCVAKGWMQMGSELKGPLVDDPVAKIMEQWRADVREKRKKQQLVKCPNNKASLPIELSFRKGRNIPFHGCTSPYMQ